MTAVTDRDMPLKSGHAMPVVGLGTWQLTGSQAEDIVAEALDIGYRHIDTAANYENEAAIGRGIRNFDREHLFVTSKVDPQYLHKPDLIEACKRSLDKLQIEYLDLYLVHWPNEMVSHRDTLDGFSELLERGLIRSAGVSNFDIPLLKELLAAAEIPICVDQIEFHPLRNRDDILAFCSQNGIAVTAYSPLARKEVLSNEAIVDIGHKYGKSPAQITLRWLIQMGASVIPKAGSSRHLKDNFDIDDFELNSEEMHNIHGINVERQLIDMHA